MDAGTAESKGPTVQVVIRYDDFFTPDLKGRPVRDVRAVELALARLHADAGIPAVFAIVPAGLGSTQEDLEIIATLKEALAKGSEIALHGYDHKNNLIMPRSPFARTWARFCQCTESEYAGLTAPAQLGRLQSGKRELEARLGCDVQTLVPPWNAYDASTVAACRAAGLKCICASRAWPVPDSSGLGLVPQTAGEQDLSHAVEYSLRQHRHLAIICTLHPRDFALEAAGNRLCVEEWGARLRLLKTVPAMTFTNVGCLMNEYSDRLDHKRLRSHRLACAGLRCLASVAGRGFLEGLRTTYPLD